jgi:hypothetical protein
MKKSMLKNMFIVGSMTLALAASTSVLPSVADAAQRTGGHAASHGARGARGHVGGNFRGRGGHGAFGGYSGYGGSDGYYGVCGPIQLTLGLCGPWGY